MMGCGQLQSTATRVRKIELEMFQGMYLPMLGVVALPEKSRANSGRSISDLSRPNVLAISGEWQIR